MKFEINVELRKTSGNAGINIFCTLRCMLQADLDVELLLAKVVKPKGVVKGGKQQGSAGSPSGAAESQPTEKAEKPKRSRGVLC